MMIKICQQNLQINWANLSPFLFFSIKWTRAKMHAVTDWYKSFWLKEVWIGLTITPIHRANSITLVQWSTASLTTTPITINKPPRMPWHTPKIFNTPSKYTIVSSRTPILWEELSYIQPRTCRVSDDLESPQNKTFMINVFKTLT